jgi:hypothetical protein
MPRTIKFGRRPAIGDLLLPVTHWAVKVGPLWYEIVGKGADSNKEDGQANEVRKNTGWEATSGAGILGGEIVGETTKTDDEIARFIETWLKDNPTYTVFEANCQKFAYEFVYFLTDGVNFRLPHRFDSALTAKGLAKGGSGFAIAEDGIAIARLATGEARASKGYFSAMYRGPSYEAAAVAGAGLGAWAGASPVGRAEVNLGPVIGVHLEPNLNTGLGVRDGNVDVHLLGFGTRLGADGLEINTPLGGANCTIS